MAAEKGTSFLSMFKMAGSDWMEDKATKLAAALAFYTMLSIAPLLILSLKVVSVVFRDTADAKIEGYLTSTVGQKAADAAADMIKNQPPGAGVVATVIGIVVLLFSASGVFGELQDSLNTIWEVKPKPNQGIMATIRQRFFSFTLVLGVAFLLLVSMIASAILSGLADHLGGGQTFFWQAVNFLISLLVITGLFALMFRYLPDVRVRWRNLWVGAALTAILFTIGKFLLGWYLGRASTTSAYGAAGSLVALLLWVYYAAQILFFGAEFTQVYARAHGDEMKPLPNAQKVTDQDRAQQGMAPARQTQDNAVLSGRATPARFTAPRPQYKPAVISRMPTLRTSVALAGVGMAAGAVAGALGASHWRRKPADIVRQRASAVAYLDGRIKAMEAKLLANRHA